MSIEYLNKALKVTGLSPTKKFILVILCNYADEKGSCYPSYQHIADMIGLQTIKSIRIAIKEFEKEGLLKIEHRMLSNGGFTSNRYHINLGAMVLKDTRVKKEYSLASSRTINTKDNTKTLYNSDFINFWNLYPRKTNKYEALKSYNKTIKIYDKNKLLEKVQEYVSYSKQIESKKFIPHASTWLNKRIYEDSFEKIEKIEKNIKTNSDWAKDLKL